MTAFLLMVLAATVLTLRSFVRLLKSRFLQPLDIAVVSTFYYGMPLAVAGFFLYNPRDMIFLHPQAADPALAVQAARYILAAIVSMYVGHWIAGRIGSPVLGTYFSLDSSGLPRAWLAFGALVAIIGFGMINFGINDFFAGYATESSTETGVLGLALIYFATGSLGVVVAYALLLNKSLSRKELWLLVIAAIAVAIFVLLIRSKRLEIVTTFLPVAIILLAARGSFKIATWRILLGGAAVSALVAVAVVRIGDTFEFFNINFYLLSEGLYAGHALPGIIHRLENGMVGYEYGIRFLNSLLAFLPRFVWEGKDAFIYSGNLALDGVSPLGATTFLAEVVLQGGIVAVVGVHLIMGFVFQRVMWFENVWDDALASGKIPGRFIAYLVIASIFVPHFRDGIIPSMKLALQAGAFFIVLVGLQRLPAELAARMRRSGRGAAAAL